ncbi:MAG: hypothetical protein WA864_26065 [Acetobacteraceae bacterium]
MTVLGPVSQYASAQREVVEMPALGCLIPFVLMIVGAAAGGAIGGTRPAIWAGVAGFVVGLLGALLALKVFERARDSLSE